MGWSASSTRGLALAGDVTSGTDFGEGSDRSHETPSTNAMATRDQRLPIARLASHRPLIIALRSYAHVEPPRGSFGPLRSLPAHSFQRRYSDP